MWNVYVKIPLVNATLLKVVGCEDSNDFIQRKREQKKCSSPSAETENLLSLHLLPKSYRDGTNYQSTKVHNFCDVPKRL
nr:unnamed protein product [uncultured bacterium]